MLMSLSVRAVAVALAALLAMPVATDAFAGAEAGKVTRIKGEASVKRGEQVIALGEGAAIVALDRIETGKEARLEVTFIDETKLTLGENAALTVDEFVYRPEESKGLSLLNLIAGAFRFTTGKIGKLTERRVEVKTGFANLAVRGTDFWGGPIDGKSGVLVLEGQVEVTTGKGKVLLDKPMAGTDLRGIDSRPGKVKVWKKAKIDRAVATVSF